MGWWGLGKGGGVGGGVARGEGGGRRGMDTMIAYSLLIINTLSSFCYNILQLNDF
jgi:hypothetical protein